MFVCGCMEFGNCMMRMLFASPTSPSYYIIIIISPDNDLRVETQRQRNSVLCSTISSFRIPCHHKIVAGSAHLPDYPKDPICKNWLLISGLGLFDNWVWVLV